MSEVRPRNFTRAWMLAAVLSAALLPATGRAYTPEQQQACSGDALRLCSADVPDVDRITACMSRNKDQLSPGCRVFFGPSESEVVPSKPLSIKPVPAKKPVTARPQKIAKPADPT
jgi:hypothetical protein